MSLETVVEDIREEARERAEEIRQEADQEAQQIIDQAEQEAEETRSQAKQDVEKQIEQEREQARSSAKLKAKQQRLGARRDLLEEAYEQVEDELAGLEDDRRQELTEALLAAARAEIDADDLQVRGRAGDEALIKEIIDGEPDLSYGGEYDCLGGVVVESSSSRIRVNNTFDSVLSDVWEENLQSISNQLFEQ